MNGIEWLLVVTNIILFLCVLGLQSQITRITKAMDALPPAFTAIGAMTEAQVNAIVALGGANEAHAELHSQMASVLTEHLVEHAAKDGPASWGNQKPQ
jgi:hypothetical protein